MNLTGEQASIKLVSFIMVQPDTIKRVQQAQNKFQNLDPINIALNRHAYTKKYKTFRFFYYESLKYCSTEPAFTAAYIKKINLNKYIQSFENTNILNDRSNNDQLDRFLSNKLFSITSYKKIHKLFNYNKTTSSINIVNKFRLDISPIFGKIGLIISGIPFIKKINGIPKYMHTDKILYKLIATHVNPPKNTRNHIRLNDRCAMLTHKLILGYIAIRSYIKIYYNSTVNSINNKIIHTLTSEKFKCAILTKIEHQKAKQYYFKNILALLSTKTLRQLYIETYTKSLKENDVTTSTIQVGNNNISISDIMKIDMYTNQSYELLLNNKLYTYLEYFDIDPTQIYAQRKLYEVLPPVNTYRAFSTHVLMSLNKYYLNIYVGKYTELEQNILPHNNNSNDNSTYYYYNKFHHILQKKEHSYIKEYGTNKRLLYSFINTNLQMLEYSSGLKTILNTNNFYYPITLNRNLAAKGKKILNVENKLFCDSFTLSEIVKTEYGLTRTQASNKSIHRHYRTKTFGIRQALNTKDNKVFNGLSGGINFQNMEKTFSKNGSLARILYANIFNNRVTDTSSDRYHVRHSIKYDNNIINKPLYNWKPGQSIITNRRLSIIRQQTKNLEKQAYIHTAYNKLRNTDNYLDNVNVRSSIYLVNNMLIKKVLIPTVLYTVNVAKLPLKGADIILIKALIVEISKLITHIKRTLPYSTDQEYSTIHRYIHGTIRILQHIYEFMKTTQLSKAIAFDSIFLIHKILLNIRLKTIKNNYTRENLNQIFTSNQYYQRINKIKFGRKKSEQNIKYLAYSVINNELTIYRINDDSALLDIAKAIFYSKSRSHNSNYNLVTKSANLLFRKLLLKSEYRHPINRWLNFKDLILDLVSNYKTVHKDSTVYEHREGYKTAITQKWHIAANYLSEGHYPYSRNLLRTTTWHEGTDFINDYLNWWMVSPTEKSLIWNIFELQNKRLETEWLFPYDGDFVGTQFESIHLSQVSTPINPEMQQNIIDIAVKDMVLWNISRNPSNNTYEPSYFTNKLYYLDYIDYIVYKHIVSDIPIDNKVQVAMNSNSFPAIHKMDMDHLSKFSWDINTYDLKHTITLEHPQYRFIPYGSDTYKRKIKRTRNEITLRDYMLHNTINNSIDPITFQSTALRWMIVHNKNIERIQQKNSNIFTKLRYAFNTNEQTQAKKNTEHILELLENTMQVPTSALKKAWEQPLVVINRIKSVDKPGMYDLTILPNYLKTYPNKEVYLYRKKVNELIEFEGLERISKVEDKRLIKSIINTNLLASSYETALFSSTNLHLIKYLETMQLYQKNIRYYDLITLNYSMFVLENTSRFLQNALSSEYEWDHISNKLYPKKRNVVTTKSIVDDYFTVYSDPEQDRPYKYTLYTRVPFNTGPEQKVSALLEITNWCNTEIFDIVYTGNYQTPNNNTFNKLNAQSMYKIQRLLAEYRKVINIHFMVQSNKMKKINLVLRKLKLKQEQYFRYSFKLLRCSIQQISEKHFMQITLSFMLLYISGLPFIKKFYDYISNNLIKNIDLASIPYVHRKKFTKLDISIFQHTMYKLNTYLETNSLTMTSTYSQSTDPYFKQHSTNEEAYYKLFNLYFERRLIWHTVKAAYSNTMITNNSLDVYTKIYKSLFVKNRLTNTKLSSNAIDKISQYYISINRVNKVLNRIPLLYSALYNNFIQQLYMQAEPVLTGYRSSEALYHRPVPFELNGIDQEPFLIYVSLNALYRWSRCKHYLTYPIKTPNKRHCQFVRYRLHDINLETRKQKLLSKYGTFITELTSIHINYLKKNRMKTTKHMFARLEKTPYMSTCSKLFDSGKLEIYCAFLKYHTGVLYYTPNLLSDSTTNTNLSRILNIPENESGYMQYFSHYFLNDSNTMFLFDDAFYHIEADAESYFLIGLGFDENMLGRRDIIVHFWDNSVEVENVTLISYLNSLSVRNSRFNKKGYTIKSDSNLQPLINIMMGDPASSVLLMVFALLLLDTDSTSLLLFNTQKNPSNLDQGNWSWLLKIPLIYIFGEEDDGEIGDLLQEHHIAHFRMLLNPWEYNDREESQYLHNSLHGQGTVHKSVQMHETEPLAPLGIEIGISPFFRIFTYSGARIWNEQLSTLLILQRTNLWNINYIADTQVFRKIFKDSTKIVINPPTITSIKDSFKNFNFPEDGMPAYIQVYHKANNISEFRRWLEMYFYGLLEYQRTVPDNYDRLFSQPSIKAFLYYNFINDKEYELVNKRTLRHLAGRIYSLQRDPARHEEFFVYPNKRVQPVQHTQRKRALKFYDFSVPRNKYSYPRTGYEAYPYSYAQNMWYFHHRLVANPHIYMQLYRGSLKIFEVDDNRTDLYIRYKHYATTYLNDMYYKYVLRYKKFANAAQVSNKFPIWHRLSKVYTNYYREMPYIYKHGLQYKLNRFFITNTIKFNDLNLLYKPLKQNTGAHTIVSFNLHPSIRDKYLLNTQSSYNLTNKIQISPKQKITSMSLLLHQQEYSNKAWKIVTKHSLATPDIGKIISAYRGFSSSVFTSNATSHEKPYGVLWSVYNRPIVDLELARNIKSLGIAYEMSNLGFNTLRASNASGLHSVLFIERDAAGTDQQYRYMGSIPMIHESKPIEVEQTFYLGQGSLAAYLNDFMALDGEIHTDEQYMGFPAGYFMMPALHGIYVPQNAFSLRNFTSYIPIRYNLSTKDLLNSNYLTTQDWYNPSFYASFVTKHFDNDPHGRRHWFSLLNYRAKNYKTRRLVTRDLFDNIEYQSLNEQESPTLKFFGRWQNHILMLWNSRQTSFSEMTKTLDAFSKHAQNLNWVEIVGMDGTEPLFVNQVNKHLSRFTDYISSFAWKAGTKEYNTSDPYNIFNSKRTESVFPWETEYMDDIDMDKMRDFIDIIILRQLQGKKETIKFGVNKRVDLNNSIVRSSIPNKVYNQITSSMNTAYVYMNRYHFINIYEHFRMKPFWYLHTEPIKNTELKYKYISPTVQKINSIYNHLLQKTNNLIYPMESQFSSNRRTKNIIRLEFDYRRSMTNHNHLRIPNNEAVTERYISLWPMKYARYYMSISDYIGLQPTKKDVYRFADIIKVKYYNMIRQATYYRPTKNFFPTTRLKGYSKLLNLEKGGSRAYSELYGDKLLKNENLYTYENFPKKLIGTYLAMALGQSTDIKKKKQSKPKKQTSNPYIEYVTEALSTQPYMNLAPRNFARLKLHKWLKDGLRTKLDTKTSSIFFDDRFNQNITRHNMMLKTYNYEVGHRHGKPNINTNLGRTLINAITTSYMYVFPYDQNLMNKKMADRLKKWKKNNPGVVETLEAINKVNKKLGLPQMKMNKRYPLLLATYGNNYNDELDKWQKYLEITSMNSEGYLEDRADFEVELINQVGHVFEKLSPPSEADNKIIAEMKLDPSFLYKNMKNRPLNFSYKNMEPIQADTTAVFGNISSESTSIPIKNVQSSSNLTNNLLVHLVKPRKYLKNVPKIHSTAISLIMQKANKLAHNMYNSAFVQPLKIRVRPRKLIRFRHIQSLRHHRGKAYADKLVNFKDNLFPPAPTEFDRGTSSVVHRDSYWQYKANKQLENASKFRTSEFFTIQVNSAKMLEHYPGNNELYGRPSIHDYIHIRGTLLNKQFVYNYNIQNTRYSLPLVEYFYYTQFNKDNTNILSIHKFHVLHKDTPTLLEDHVIGVSPFIQKSKNSKYITTADSDNTHQNKIERILVENVDFGSLMDTYQYNLTTCNEDVLYDSYIFINSFSRPIVHWFVKIYYNNIHYFDAFYSWCCDNLSNIIVF